MIENSIFEIIDIVSFYAIFIIAFVCGFWWYDLRKSYRSLSLYTSIIGVLVVLLGEVVTRVLVPSESVPLRVDLMFVIPLTFFIISMGLARLLYVFINNRSYGFVRISGKLFQFSCLLFFGGVAIAWFFFYWIGL